MGNMGSIVGPPVAKQLSSLMSGKVSVQGVEYPADAGVRLSPYISLHILSRTTYINNDIREMQTWAPAAVPRWPLWLSKP